MVAAASTVTTSRVIRSVMFLKGDMEIRALVISVWVTTPTGCCSLTMSKRLMFLAVMSLLAHLRVGVFHEDLSAVRRDIEVAQFRLGSGPSMMVSTECGGEGRNFQFCNRLVLFDLPWDPMVIEQRIGRLDRIGRRHDVEIVYFRRPPGLASAIVSLMFLFIGFDISPALSRDI